MRTVSTIAVVLAMLVAVTALAFYIQARPAEDPHVLRWENPRIEYRIGHTTVPGFEDDQEALDAAIAAAFQTWQDVECSSVAFTAGEPIDNPTDWEHPEDPYILVYFIADQGTAENAFFLQGTDQRSVAKYWFIYENETFHIIAGTVYLNAYDYQWSTADAGEADKMDVQATVTALVGRSLGLQSRVRGATTISGRWQTGDVERRTLEPDDIDGIVYLYPREDCPGCVIVEPQQVCVGQFGEDCPPAGLVDAGPAPDAGPEVVCGDGDADSDGDSDADGDGDTDADGDGDGDGDTDADADTDADGDLDGDSDADPETAADDGCCSVAPGAASRHDALGLLGALGVALLVLRRRAKL